MMKFEEYLKYEEEFLPKFLYLMEEQKKWSEKTFGITDEYGPIRSLKHLEKEAKEAYEKPDDIVEYADCLMLLLDAIRRQGFNIIDVTNAALKKLEINKMRTYPKPVGDEPSFHIKEEKQLIKKFPAQILIVSDTLQDFVSQLEKVFKNDKNFQLDYNSISIEKLAPCSNQYSCIFKEIK